MKIKFSPEFYLVCIAMFISTVLHSQELQRQSFPFLIPNGQEIYTQDDRGFEPYNKTYFEQFGAEITKFIEIGDYVVRSNSSSNKSDTLYFGIKTLKILRGDTTITFTRVENKKKILFPLKAQLTFESNRIIVSPKQNLLNIASTAAESGIFVNGKEELLYFKLAPGERFNFIQQSGFIGLLTIPVRLRLSGSQNSELSTAVSGLNNLAFYGGFRSSWYRFESGNAKQLSLLIGPYIGITAARLTPANTDNILTEDILRPGGTAGLGIMIGFDRLHFGLAFGFESAIDGKTLNWAHQGDPYFGISIGYTKAMKQF